MGTSGADTSSNTANATTAPASGAAKMTFPALSALPSRWPKTIKLTKPASIPLQDDGKTVGEIALSSGEPLELLRVQANGILQVRARGQVFYVPGQSTNVLDVVVPATSVLAPAKTTPAAPKEEPVETSIRPRRPPTSSGEETPFGSRQNSTKRSR
jgi:hypothetical protein